MEKMLQLFKKANLFKKHFLCQCNPLPNDSKLPENQTYFAEANLSSFDIKDEDIYKTLDNIS